MLFAVETLEKKLVDEFPLPILMSMKSIICAGCEILCSLRSVSFINMLTARDIRGRFVGFSCTQSRPIFINLTASSSRKSASSTGSINFTSSFAL